MIVLRKYSFKLYIEYWVWLMLFKFLLVFYFFSPISLLYFFVLGTSIFGKIMSILAAELGWIIRKTAENFQNRQREEMVVFTFEVFKIYLKNCHTIKFCHKSHKNNNFLKIIPGIFLGELCVAYFLDNSISLRGMLPLNMLVEYMYFSQKHHHEGIHYGAKVIQIGIFGAFRLSRKMMSTFVTVLFEERVQWILLQPKKLELSTGYVSTVGLLDCTRLSVSATIEANTYRHHRIHTAAEVKSENGIFFYNLA